MNSYHHDERIVYKLTTRDFKTRKGEYNECTWGPNVTHTASGGGDLCGPGWLHAYTHPLLAILLNPIHANIYNPVLWEARGSGKFLSGYGLKVGFTSLTTVRILDLPTVTAKQKVAFAELCAAAASAAARVAARADAAIAANAAARAVDNAASYAASVDAAAYARAAARAANDAAHARAGDVVGVADAAARAAARAAYAANAANAAIAAAYSAASADAAGISIDLIDLANRAMES